MHKSVCDVYFSAIKAANAESWNEKSKNEMKQKRREGIITHCLLTLARIHQVKATPNLWL